MALYVFGFSTLSLNQLDQNLAVGFDAMQMLGSTAAEVLWIRGEPVVAHQNLRPSLAKWVALPLPASLFSLKSFSA